MNQLKDEPKTDTIVVSILHQATFDLRDMTVVKFKNPNEKLILVRAKNYEDHVRPKFNFKSDASNLNIKGKWPKSVGEYAFLWAKTVKGD